VEGPSTETGVWRVTIHGSLPRRKRTTFRTKRKFEIKNIFVLFVLLYDALMMVVEAIETCRCMGICDRTYFIDVRFVFLLHKHSEMKSSVYWEVTQS
jgi:hypothetical protein